MTRANRDDRLILLTGATGYVGGRLLRVLEHQGHRVRCLARRPEFLKPRVSAETEIVAADVLDPTSLGSALRGVSAAYYLVHSMGSAGSFEENDRQSARNFAAAAKAEGVELIICLGALGNDGETLSPSIRRRRSSLQAQFRRQVSSLQAVHAIDRLSSPDQEARLPQFRAGLIVNPVVDYGVKPVFGF